MYVCVCQAVTDRQIDAAIDNGARTMRDLRQELGVCSCCGKCGPHARAMLQAKEPDGVPDPVIEAGLAAAVPA
jgi:bacterioferritin-associated ferredoxin